jgi:GNAT superfamily N-acetyltransferase
MQKSELLARYDREQRIELRLPGMVYEHAGRILRDTSVGEGAGFIDYAWLDAGCADAEIDAQVAHYAALGLPFTWKVYDHDRPADLRQRLARRGFTTGQPEALLILDLHTSGEGAAPPAPDSRLQAGADGMVLQEVTDAAGLEDILRLEDQVWHTPHQGLRQHLLHLLETSPDRLSLFAVRRSGQVVAAAWTLYSPGSQFARLLGGATLPAYRRGGCYTALLAARLAQARRRGLRFLCVDASPMSRPLLEKHGFDCLGFANRCRWTPSSP